MLTFRTYATWLPGDARGSTTRGHRGYDTPSQIPSPGLEEAMARLQPYPSLILDAAQRAAVDFAIRDHCAHKRWHLRALNVRTNHVHVVLSANGTPERLMNELKSWSTRRMVEQGVLARGARAWARHGSTRYLWTVEAIDEACRYVHDGQGAVLVPRP